jgi:hypothetical protein
MVASGPMLSDRCQARLPDLTPLSDWLFVIQTIESAGLFVAKAGVR